MKSKISAMLLSLVLATGCAFALAACTEDKPIVDYNPPAVLTSEGLNFDLSEDGTYGVVKDIGSCTDKDIVIPSEYENKPVKEIASFAFAYQEIKSVTIPDGVTKIGVCAFALCHDLENVVIPNSVTQIERLAFDSCPNLLNVTIPDSVISIGESAFSGSALKQIYVGSGLKTLGDNVFAGCLALESIEVSEDNALFSSQQGILYNKSKTHIIYVPFAIQGDVILADGITEIEPRSFFACVDITSITIPFSVNKIGENAFLDCKKLTDIYYGGTKAQWNAVEKSEGWDYNITGYTIHCLIGDIEYREI